MKKNTYLHALFLSLKETVVKTTFEEVVSTPVEDHLLWLLVQKYGCQATKIDPVPNITRMSCETIFFKLFF